MAKYNWLKTIKINILLLKIAGIWPDKSWKYAFNIYSIYAFTSILVFILGDVFFLSANIFFKLDDLEELTKIVFVLPMKVVTIYKVCYIIKNIHVLKQLIFIIKSNTFQPRNKRQLLLVKPILLWWKQCYIMLWIISIGTILFWGLFPILDKSYKNYALPFLAWYPYNVAKSPNYQLTYGYQLLCICYIAIVNIDIGTLISALNMYIAAQFEILCDKLRHFSDKNVIDGANAQLMKCIRHHRLILKFAKVSNTFCNWMIFLQFCVSALAIALTMFQLTLVAPFSTEFFGLLFYEFGMSTEIFIYCYFGNEVQIKSDSLAYAAFESDWTSQPEKLKKKLIFLVMKCEKPLKVSALTLFHLSIETFVKILRTAWSYFALLRQVNAPAMP